MRTSSFASDLGRLLLAAMVDVCSGACAKDAEIPAPPDVSPILAIYDEPDGRVDAATAASVLTDAVAVAAVISLSGVGVEFRDLFRSVRARADEELARVREDGSLEEPDFEIDASVTLRRTCNGWSDPDAAPDPMQNGVLEAHGVVSDDVVVPRVWGHTMGACLQMTDTMGTTVRSSFQGTFVLDETPKGDAFFALFDGILGTPITPSLTGEHDFRVLRSGEIEVRAAAKGGGFVIAFVGSDEVGLRGSNGRYVCALARRFCESPDGRGFQW
jgi:hypothetical protein